MPSHCISQALSEIDPPCIPVIINCRGGNNPKLKFSDPILLFKFYVTDPSYSYNHITITIGWWCLIFTIRRWR